MEQKVALAYWKLGLLRSDELPEIAADWLASGLDTPSLRELGGILNPELSVVGPIFEAAMKELAIEVPSRDEALIIIAQLHAQQIVDGSVSPYEGARKIWWEVSNLSDSKNPLLLAFVGAASELDDLQVRTKHDDLDREAYRQELEELIISEAKKLLDLKC